MTFRSAIIGLVSTVVDFVILAVGVSVFAVSPLVANVPALLAGVTVQFIGNKYWAFRDPSPRIARQLTLFPLVELAALALNAGLFHVAVAGGLAGPFVARPVVSALVYFTFSQVLWRRIFVVPSASA